MIKVQKQDFNPDTELQALRGGNPDVGAVVSFLGVVREGSGDQKITSMTLEHYPGMTERQLQEIENEARKRWALSDCLIIHRYGTLRPGDNIVLVMTLSRHRQDAFHAAEFLMDYLKTSAPFWKKEVIAGEEKWVEAKQSDVEATKSWFTTEKKSAKPK